jgi:glycosyltransferase involved in cell wall biosynthesis
MTPTCICLVTSAHLSYNPRLLKEADTLHEAGYNVRVVAMRLQADKARWDEQLMARRNWKLERLDACNDNLAGRVRWFKAGLRQRIFQWSQPLQRRKFGLERAYSRYFDELSCHAARNQADLFIAHNLQALPAAAVAARRWQSKLGFDAEDFHRGEIHAGSKAEILHRRLVESIEQKYILKCHHLTAASDGIGDAYAAALGIRKPVTILNVFPLTEREGRTPHEKLQQERPGAGLSLYWYSQVIGADRGLDDVLRAMALLGSGVHLSLRGTWAEGFERIFRKQAQTLGVDKNIHILLPTPPDQLVECAAQHDVGLALEPATTQNRRIAVSNKILNYFLAGLAVTATDVPGQRGIMEHAPEAGFLFNPGDAENLAAHLREWLRDPAKLQAAKVSSKRAGENLFCWDREKASLIRAVSEIINQ